MGIIVVINFFPVIGWENDEYLSSEKSVKLNREKLKRQKNNVTKMKKSYKNNVSILQGIIY